MDAYLREATERLIAADTVSHRANDPLVEWMADELDRQGFRVALQREPVEAGGAKLNLVAWAGPAEPGGLVLSGHVDIVPYRDQPGWTRDPLALSLEGDRAYGRGTSDMKGFLALCLDAARRLDPARLRKPLAFLFTSDEEIGCQGAQRLVPELPDLLGDLPTPRLAWIGEPTSWRVFHSHKGIVAFGVEVQGEGGHSGVPELGVNAIAIAARAVETVGGVQAELRGKLDPAARADFPDSPYTTLNFGSISGGTAANMIAERCFFGVSYRPLPGTDPLAPYREIAARLDALEPRDYGSPDRRGSIRVGEPMVVPAMRSARGTSLEQALFSALGTEESGGAPYCTDGGRFADAGMDSLICGPGDLDQAHQPDECIRLAALQRGTRVMDRVLDAICGAGLGA